MASAAGLSPVRRVLGNGAAALVQRTRTHPAVTVALTLPAGAVCDPADRPGLAHFVSRLIDRGTARRTSSAIADALEDRGVSLNSGVSRHLFMLSCSCLAEDVSAVVGLVAEILAESEFPWREIEARRAEIATWIRQDDDNPAAVASDAVAALLFSGHPYGRPLKGSLESVHTIGREDLLRFHRARFAPAGLKVALVGDIDPAHADDLLDRTFGSWTAPPPAPAAVARTPEPQATRRVVITMEGKPQADIVYGLPGVARSDRDFYPVWLMNNVLGQYGLGGRLGDSIRERQGLAYYAYSSLETDIAGGALIVRAGVAGENVDRTLESIGAEVVRLRRDGVTPAELSDARHYLVGSLPRMLETNDGIATFLLTAEHFGLGLDFDRRLPALLEGVTLDDVNAAAASLLRTDRASIAIAGPYAERPAGLAA